MKLRAFKIQFHPKLNPDAFPLWPLPILAAALTMAPALGGAILGWDDRTYLADSAIQGTSCFLERLCAIFTSSYFGNYNPLHRVGNWIQLALWGQDPRGFHLVSLALHSANSLLAFVLARRLGFHRWAALLASLLFAVHPSRVEVAGWISAQKDLGATFFALLALIVYAPVATGASRRPVLGLCWTGALFVLAILCKSMLLTLPLLFLLVDALWKRPLRRAIIEKLPLLAISGAMCLLTVAGAPKVGPIGGDWGTHFATAIQAPAVYLERVLWPIEFSARWWVPRPSSFLAPLPLAGLLVLTVGGFLVLRQGRTARGEGGRAVLLAALWPAACMLPVLNWVPIPIVVADRYLYLALLGPFLALASWWVAGARLGPWTPSVRARAATAAALLLAFASLSHRHSQATKDTETLWRRSLAAQEENPVVRLYLADEILARRPTMESAEETLAILHPALEQAGESQTIHVARSRALDLLGRTEEADAELEQAMDLGRRKQLRWETAVQAARRLVEDGKHDEAHGVLRLCRPRWSLEEERLAEAHAEVCLEAEDSAGYLLWNAELLRWRPFSIILWSSREAVARRLGLDEEAERAGRRFEELQPPELKALASRAR